MITDDLFNEVLIKPSKLFNRLKIISGYASPAMANKHLERLPPGVSIDLVVGMTPADGIGRGGHKGFQTLNTDIATFNCNYVITPPAVHIKSYIWLKDNTPQLAFTGSGNYSQNAFFGGTKESFAEDNPSDCNALFEAVKTNSISCLSSDVEARVKFYDELYKKNGITRAIEAAQVSEIPSPVVYDDCHTLSLLSSKDGETHTQSGLNWGQRPGREKNQAYIPVPAKVAQSGFFPNRANHFTLISDDGQSFDCVIAQQGDKAIETTKNNSILGKYFRQRMGLELGAYVRREHLESYGRTDVRICKIDNETFFMDFSV